MRARSAFDWGGAALVVIALALAVFGAFMFGTRFHQVYALLAVLIFVVGLTGVYWKKDF